MSALIIRAVAVTLMLVDHIGYFGGISQLRVIGRLSYPIFAFLIANGFKYTRNVYRYMLRISVFALISEFAYDYCFNGGEVVFVDFSGMIPRLKLDNVFFTLLIGLCFLFVHSFINSRAKRPAFITVPILLLMAYGASFISSDYGAIGVLWVALFGLLDVREKRCAIPLAIGAAVLATWRIVIKSVTAFLGVSFTHVPFVNAFIQSGSIGVMDKIQCIAALSLIILLTYNGKSGSPRSKHLKTAIKYAFYAFYPLHILILYAIFR